MIIKGSPAVEITMATGLPYKVQSHWKLKDHREYFKTTEADQFLCGPNYFSRSWRGHHQHIYYHKGHKSQCASCTSPVNSVSCLCDCTPLSWGALPWLVTVCFGPHWFTGTGIWTILQILHHLCLINDRYSSITLNNYQWPSTAILCLFTSSLEPIAL